MKFPFLEDENVAVITCRHILENRADICFVTHDEDGIWQFMCGENFHIESDARVISLGEAFDLDNSIEQIADMPPGHGASREYKHGTWKGFRLIKT
ncbi:MAG: hypothetical protein R3Y12_05680 [Clostridia bacterium]